MYVEDKIKKGKDLIAQKADLPLEIILDVPKITIVGYKEITIENHKGILSFDKLLIRINSKLGPIKIEGKELEILYIGTYTVTISGKFKSILYEGINYGE